MSRLSSALPGRPKVNPTGRRILSGVLLSAILLGGCQKDRAQAHFGKAEDALVHMNLAAARKEFHAAIEASPSSHLAGRAFYELGRMDDLYGNDPQKASGHYMKSLENLKDGKLRQRVSIDLATDLDHLGKPDEALAILRRLEGPDLLPSYEPRVWDLSARILEHEGRYAEALAYYKKVSARDGDSFRGQKAQFKAGLLENLTSDPHSAAADLQHFVDRYPGSPFAPIARFNLALTLDRLGDHQKALSILESIKDNYPNHDVVLQRMAEIRHEIREQSKQPDSKGS